MACSVYVASLSDITSSNRVVQPWYIITYVRYNRDNGTCKVYATGSKGDRWVMDGMPDDGTFKRGGLIGHITAQYRIRTAPVSS
jgi:hypothetical protein